MTEFIRVKNTINNVYELISVKEPLYIKYSPTFSTVTLRNREYLKPITLEGLKEFAILYDYYECDKHVYVNIAQLRKMHSTLNYLLFNDVSSIKEAKEKKEKMLFLEDKKVATFKRILGQENDLAYVREERGGKFIFKRSYRDELI